MFVSFKAIGRNIRAARTALDITQEEAAERVARIKATDPGVIASDRLSILK